MKFMARILARIALLALMASAPAYAQSTTQQNPPAQPPAAKQPGTPAAAPADQPPAPPVNKEEEDAYKAFFESKDNALTAKLGEDFVQKFPVSRYLEAVYTRLTRAYQGTGQEKEMFSNGEKVLSMNPDNVDVLAMMCWAIPRRWDPKSLDATQRLAKAEQYSKRAQQILTTIAKPDHLTQEQFDKVKNDNLAMAHSGLGLVYFYLGRLTDSASEFNQATKLSVTPDWTDYYLSGLVLARLGKYTEATEAFGRCADNPNVMQDSCKQEREVVKKKAAAAPAPAPPKP